MSTWVVVLIAWVVLSRFGPWRWGRRRSRLARRRARLARRWGWWGPWIGGGAWGMGRWGGSWDDESAPSTRPLLPPESPVERLQREWVEGRITVEEYEDGLDRIYRQAR